MLPLVDAAFGWLTGWPPARASNFVTAFFYAAGPAFLFLFAWRVSRFLETSFFAALVYSLFSPSVIFSAFRSDAGGVWNRWRLRVLVFYGEGPHTVMLSVLPLALLFTYLAIVKRKYLWGFAAGVTMAFLVLVNALGAVDLAIGCACLLLALQIKKIPSSAILVAAIAIPSYLWASPFLPPSMIRTISARTQFVGGDFSPATLRPTQLTILAAFVLVWLAVRKIPDYFTRFSLLLSFVYFSITACSVLWNRAALPQPNRYSVEMGGTKEETCNEWCPTIGSPYH